MILPMVFLLLLAAGCANGGPGNPNGTTSEESTVETTAEEPAETTEDTGMEPTALKVEQISSGAPGQGPRRPRVVVAPTAAALSEELDARIPDSGRGTYLAVFWGQKPTGGYSLGVASARREGEGVTVRLMLEKPPEDAMVTQALTYPYAVAVVRGVDAGQDFAFVDQDGRQLDWPVRKVGG